MCIKNFSRYYRPNLSFSISHQLTPNCLEIDLLMLLRPTPTLTCLVTRHVHASPRMCLKAVPQTPSPFPRALQTDIRTSVAKIQQRSPAPIDSNADTLKRERKKNQNNVLVVDIPLLWLYPLACIHDSIELMATKETNYMEYFSIPSKVRPDRQTRYAHRG